MTQTGSSLNDPQDVSERSPGLSPLSGPVSTFFEEEIFTDNIPVGIGLRSDHYQDILDAATSGTSLGIGWIEVHPENYFGGGLNKHFLDQISQYYPVSLHGVGLSLGSDQPLNETHLANYKSLIDRYDPFNISDHVSWSASGNAHLNDLLPLPYTQETLERLCRNINQAQDYFGRAMLVENPSTYIAYKDNDMTEYDFMNALCDKTGCFMLLDVNNIYVQSHNHNLDATAYINAIEGRFVREIHLAGHVEKTVQGQDDEDHIILVDTHNQMVKDAVWDLYAHTIKKIGLAPTLLEWDQDVPALDVLLGQVQSARDIIGEVANKKAV